MQQRARSASTALTRDLVMAGAGLSAGPRTGALVAYFAPVVPRRLGLNGADAVNVARADVVTIAYVPADAGADDAESMRYWPGRPTSRRLTVPNCPVGRALCGLEEGMNVLVFDTAGILRSVQAVEAWALASESCSICDGLANHSYAAGAFASQVELHTLLFRSGGSSAASLRRRRKPMCRSSTTWSRRRSSTSAIRNRRSHRSLRQVSPIVSTTPRAIRSRAWRRSPTDGASLTTTAAARCFTDGPWCGDGGTAFDADLLRVRRVRVTLRLQAAAAGLRGAGADYAVSGISRRALASRPGLLNRVRCLAAQLELREMTRLMTSRLISRLMTPGRRSSSRSSRRCSSVRSASVWRFSATRSPRSRRTTTPGARRYMPLRPAPSERFQRHRSRRTGACSSAVPCGRRSLTPRRPPFCRRTSASISRR